MEPWTTMTDEQLAVLAQEGEAAPRGELLGRLRPRLVRYLVARTGRWDMAEDLVQETLILVHRHLDQYRPGWPLSGWAFGIARHLLQRAAATRRPVVGPLPRELGSRSSAPDYVLSSSEAQEDLWRQIAQQLRGEDFVGLWLVHSQGLTLRQAGRVVGRSPASLKVRLWRARQRLRRAWCSPGNRAFDEPGHDG